MLIRAILIIACLSLTAQTQSFYGQFRPNYFGMSYEEEEPHIEFLLSVRYPSTQLPNKPRPTHSFFGTYSGLYDFSVITRESEPVVSRMQNVGLHYRLNLNATNAPWSRNLLAVRKLTLRYLEISLSHESNGQSVDSLFQYMPYLNSEDEFVSKNADDYVSISTHYIGLAANLRYDGFKDDKLYAYIELRPLMLTPEDAVYSTPEYTGGLYQYKLFRIILGHEYDVQASDDADLPRKFWDISISRAALEVKWQFIRLGKVPLFLAAGTDKADELSSYHRQDNYVNLGIALR